MPQNELETYLNKLKRMQAEFADAALRRPKDKSDFGYGVACGTYQGLLTAEQLLTQSIEEVADDQDE